MRQWIEATVKKTVHQSHFTGQQGVKAILGCVLLSDLQISSEIVFVCEHTFLVAARRCITSGSSSIRVSLSNLPRLLMWPYRASSRCFSALFTYNTTADFPNSNNGWCP